MPYYPAAPGLPILAYVLGRPHEPADWIVQPHHRGCGRYPLHRRFSRILGLMWQQRERLLTRHPWLPVIRNGRAFTPVAALLILWQDAPRFRGPCPACGGLALGVGFVGGAREEGAGVHGRCTDCGEALRLRSVKGFWRGYGGPIRDAVQGTPYKLRSGGEPYAWLLQSLPPELMRAVSRTAVEKDAR